MIACKISQEVVPAVTAIPSRSGLDEATLIHMVAELGC